MKSGCGETGVRFPGMPPRRAVVENLFRRRLIAILGRAVVLYCSWLVLLLLPGGQCTRWGLGVKK